MGNQFGLLIMIQETDMVAIREAHFNTRLMERYGEVMSDSDKKTIGELIDKADDCVELVSDHTFPNNEFVVFYNLTKYRFIYNVIDHILVTALPRIRKKKKLKPLKKAEFIRSGNRRRDRVIIRKSLKMEKQKSVVLDEDFEILEDINCSDFAGSRVGFADIEIFNNTDVRNRSDKLTFNDDLTYDDYEPDSEFTNLFDEQDKFDI